MDNIFEKLEKIVGHKNIYKDEPMSKHTSFKIGGNADYYVKVSSVDALKELLSFCKTNRLPFIIVGNGTNLLVKEGGIRGIVIKLELFDYKIEKQEGNAYITVGCGMQLAKLAFIAMQNELSGLEAISGIPGTIGGAIRMNAGSYGTEMKDIVVSSKCMNYEGEIIELNIDEHEFGHRTSAFKDNKLIILQTKLKLTYGLKSEIEQKMKEYKEARAQKQPLEFPNAGSTFKRIPDIPTAKLIDDCGLKGYSIGGAEVSLKHSGFIINKGNATSDDVLNLVEYVRKEVKNKFDKDIELEIIVIGE